MNRIESILEISGDSQPYCLQEVKMALVSGTLVHFMSFNSEKVWKFVWVNQNNLPSLFTPVFINYLKGLFNWQKTLFNDIIEQTKTLIYI